MKMFEVIWNRAALATKKKVVDRILKGSKRKEVNFEVGQQVWVYIPESFYDWGFTPIYVSGVNL
jgi:hypothetical protein